MATNQTYYISSGRLNAMYTLRVMRAGGGYYSDNYICNLSTDPDTAEAKAKEYFDRVEGRIQQSEDFKLTFAGYADFELGTRAKFEGRTLSTRDTMNIELVEAGEMPFGKHRGKKIASLDAGYLLWWSDRAKEESRDPVTCAIVAACTGVALEMGYIAERERKTAERLERDARSEYIGEIKQRLELEGNVEKIIWLSPIQVAWNTFQQQCMIVIVVDDSHRVVYFGSSNFAEEGQRIKFKATVKNHEEYKGVKQTVIQRPALIEVI